jgi:segregation and condensation protein A
MSYAVRIEAFEGPLDLLLFLIRKNEMEISDIPIAQITQQYLAYLDVMKMLDLEVAGDFLVVAATLMQIKARMLLPTPTGFEEEDPRAELVQQLEEYRLFKQAAQELAERESTYIHYFLREAGPGPVELPEEDAEGMLDVSLFDLLQAFQDALERIREEGRYQVTGPEVKLTDQIEFLRSLLAGSKRIDFFEVLVKMDHRMAMVVTLVAVLELARLGELSVEQPEPYGPIHLVRRTPPVALVPETLR